MVFNTFSSKKKHTQKSVNDQCARAKGLEKEEKNRRNWRLVKNDKLEKSA